jgi:hypothetical protein
MPVSELLAVVVCLQVRFVVMGNIMRTDLPVHRVFDLKGSSVGRVTEGKITPTTVLKDLDLDCTFRLEEGWCARGFIINKSRSRRFQRAGCVLP